MSVLKTVGRFFYFNSLPWQHPLTNWKISTDPSSEHKVLSYGENIAKIRPLSADIQRNTPVFWPCCTWRSQVSSIISGVTRQKFTKFLHDIATSSALLKRTFRQWYCKIYSPLGNLAERAKKKKKLMQAKYIALPASLPSGLNKNYTGNSVNL